MGRGSRNSPPERGGEVVCLLGNICPAHTVKLICDYWIGKYEEEGNPENALWDGYYGIETTETHSVSTD